jgi:diacylglycerol kinase (ATP)
MGRLWKALFYSLAGLRDAWGHPACRLEMFAIVLAVPFALALPVTATDRLILIGSVVAIFIVELLNTSIESAIDRIGAERHELSRVAKDVGSAAVLVTALMAAAMWIGIAGPPLSAWWRG